MTADAIPRFAPDRFAAVAIGASTGAPQHITSILAGLPADLQTPIFIAQHLPPAFTTSFAASLDRTSPLHVTEAEHGMPVLPGVVYLGRGRQHLRVKRGVAGKPWLEISDQPAHLLYKPSADELLRSVATIYGRQALGVVLTGMGADGAIGAEAIHAAGGMVLAQDAASCTVYGMPRACVERGVVTASLSPDAIRRCLLQLSPQHHRLAIA